jgi:hypothetical protein
MFVSVRDLPVMLSPTGILGCRHCWRWHLFTIQKSFALFQIMSIGAMDLAPLLYVVGASEGSPFLLIGVLFFMIAVSSAVLLISLFRASVDVVSSDTWIRIGRSVTM